MRERIEHNYETEISEVRAMCDTKPTVRVRLIERVTTTTRHDDGSTSTHETPARTVASWTYNPKADQE